MLYWVHLAMSRIQNHNSDRHWLHMSFLLRQVWMYFEWISFCSLFYILIKVQIEQRSILYLNPGFWTWFTQQVPLVEQELHTLQRTWGHLQLWVWCNSFVSFLCSVLLALFVYSWFFFWSYSQTCHVITSFHHTVKPAMQSPLLIIVNKSNLPCDHLFWS